MQRVARFRKTAFVKATPTVTIDSVAGIFPNMKHHLASHNSATLLVVFIVVVLLVSLGAAAMNGTLG